MKISEVLSFMGIEFAIRGDIDYSPDIRLSELDADWPKGMPSNEEFHAASIGCEQKIIERQKLLEKKMHYPDAIDWMIALTKQIEFLSKDGFVPEFKGIKDALDFVDNNF